MSSNKKNEVRKQVTKMKSSENIFQFNLYQKDYFEIRTGSRNSTAHLLHVQ
jgi:hypothetical protein